MSRFDLNLPHAGTVALRIAYVLDRDTVGHPARVELLTLAEGLVELLIPYSSKGQNPCIPEAIAVTQQALIHSRQLVLAIERWEVGHDRLGQCVRNLFECLQSPTEGSALGLKAGENPNSLMR